MSITQDIIATHNERTSEDYILLIVPSWNNKTTPAIPFHELLSCCYVNRVTGVSCVSTARECHPNVLRPICVVDDCMIDGTVMTTSRHWLGRNGHRLISCTQMCLKEQVRWWEWRAVIWFVEEKLISGYARAMSSSWFMEIEGWMARGMVPGAVRRTYVADFGDGVRGTRCC